MNRGGGRRTVFRDDNDRHAFKNRIAEASERFDLAVIAYCLLSNHYHLVLRAPCGDVSAPMQYLGAQYTRYHNRRHETDGALFRGRYKSVAISSDSQLITAVRYVHANVFDIGPHADPRTHPWSSHPIYLGRTACPPWFDASLVLAMVGGPDALHRLVTSPRAA